MGESARRQRRVDGFVLDQIGDPPARVLEVGCGKGELAFALAGYSVTAIDPLAPEGSIFRRVGIEEFSEPGPFDHVVAILSPDNGIESVVLGTNWPSSEGPPVTKLAQRRTAARSYAPTCDTLTVPWRSMPP